MKYFFNFLHRLANFTSVVPSFNPACWILFWSTGNNVQYLSIMAAKPPIANEPAFVFRHVRSGQYKSCQNLKLETLLVDVKLIIMSYLDSFQDLQSLATTSHAFYGPFAAYKNQILNSIILNSLDEDLHPIAELTAEASLIDVGAQSEGEALIVLDKYSKQHGNPKCHWPYSTEVAEQMGRIHKAINFFADEFVALALADMPQDLPRFTVAPTPLERKRIVRALYLREVFLQFYLRLDSNFYDPRGDTLPAFDWLYYAWDLNSRVEQLQVEYLQYFMGKHYRRSR